MNTKSHPFPQKITFYYVPLYEPNADIQITTNGYSEAHQFYEYARGMSNTNYCKAWTKVTINDEIMLRISYSVHKNSEVRH